MRQRNSSASNTPSPAQRNFSAQLQPTVSSPLPTPPIPNQPPHHPSAIMSPTGEYPPSMRQTPQTNNTAHTTSLLNLLKFSQQPAKSPLASFVPAPSALESPAPMNNAPADLLATLMGTVPVKKENEDLSTRIRNDLEKDASEAEAVKAPSMDTQNYLLQLLNRPSGLQPESTGSTVKPSLPAHTALPETESHAAAMPSGSSVFTQHRQPSATNSIATGLHNTSKESSTEDDKPSVTSPANHAEYVVLFPCNDATHGMTFHLCGDHNI